MSEYFVCRRGGQTCPTFSNRAFTDGCSAIGVFVALIAAAVIALALFDWNHARGWIRQKVKERTGREVGIEGDLRVHPSTGPKRARGKHNRLQRGLGRPDIIVADTLDFSFGLVSLLRGRVVFPEVALGDAKVLLQRDSEGRRNWFLRPEREKTGESPEIHRLTVNKGRLTVKDVMTDTDVTSTCSRRRTRSTA